MPGETPTLPSTPPQSREFLRRAAALLLAAGPLSCNLPAQMHKVAKPEQVLRAVGVYEWTGDLAKPTANRLVPVTIFADGELRDAGAYLSRPIPFALSPGNEYELDRGGVPEGMLDLGYAEHLLGASSTTAQTYDDGWFGYGSFRPLAPPKKGPVLQAARTPGVITTSRDGKEITGAPTKPSTTSSDPDPDRPTMRRRTSDPDTAATSDTDPTKSDKSDSDQNSNKPDPERPTLRRRPPDDPKQKKAKPDVATVTARGSITDDPDRPRLHRGNTDEASGADRNVPKLVGLPAGLHQTAAVSDAADRPTHDFSRPWTDEAEHSAVLAKMRNLAQTQLAQTNPQTGAAATAAAPKAASSTRTPNPRSQTRTRKPAAHTSATALTDEDLKAYTLSYGGAPTFVYSAQTTDVSPDNLRYVTVVAQANIQADIQGELRPALTSVADSKHLDQTPRMRIIDVVDADASNRASLLVELRSENARQFALYRLLGADAEQTFVTGTTQ